MTIKNNVKADSIKNNRSQSAVAVKSNVRAGSIPGDGLTTNHNQTSSVA